MVGDEHEYSSKVSNQIGPLGRRTGLSADAHGHRRRDGRIHSDRENAGGYLRGANDQANELNPTFSKLGEDKYMHRKLWARTSEADAAFVKAKR